MSETSSAAPKVIPAATVVIFRNCPQGGPPELLMVQRANNLQTSSYDLTRMNLETMRPGADNGKFGWAALSPDASIALGNSGPPGSNSENIASLGQSALYDVASGAALMAPGFSELVTRAATPAFSPDGSMVAFNFFAGPGGMNLTALSESLPDGSLSARPGLDEPGQ